jgi:hypothetical protein
MSTKPTDLNASVVWAATLVVLGFLGFLAFLINANKTAEVRSILVLIGQGFFALVNVFIVYRSTKSTNAKVEIATEKVEHVAEVAEDVKQTVNGTTPQPGTIPQVEYRPEH